MAETLIELFPERIDELHGTLGRHYKEAGEAKLAAEHYEQAARRAEDIFAYEEAAQFLEFALELTSAKELTEKRISLLEVLGDMRNIPRREHAGGKGLPGGYGPVSAN